MIQHIFLNKYIGVTIQSFINTHLMFIIFISVPYSKGFIICVYNSFLLTNYTLINTNKYIFTGQCLTNRNCASNAVYNLLLFTSHLFDKQSSCVLCNFQSCDKSYIKVREKLCILQLFTGQFALCLLSLSRVFSNCCLYI